MSKWTIEVNKAQKKMYVLKSTLGRVVVITLKRWSRNGGNLIWANCTLWNLLKIEQDSGWCFNTFTCCSPSVKHCSSALSECTELAVQAVRKFITEVSAGAKEYYWGEGSVHTHLLELQSPPLIVQWATPAWIHVFVEENTHAFTEGDCSMLCFFLLSPFFHMHHLIYCELLLFYTWSHYFSLFQQTLFTLKNIRSGGNRCKGVVNF